MSLETKVAELTEAIKRLTDMLQSVHLAPVTIETKNVAIETEVPPILQKQAEVFPATIPVVPAPEPLPVAVPTFETPTPEIVTPTPLQQTPITQEVVYTDLQMKKMAGDAYNALETKSKGAGVKVVELLSKYNVTAISSLPQDQRQTFVDDLTALVEGQ